MGNFAAYSVRIRCTARSEYRLIGEVKCAYSFITSPKCPIGSSLYLALDIDLSTSLFSSGLIGSSLYFSSRAARSAAVEQEQVIFRLASVLFSCSSFGGRLVDAVDKRKLVFHGGLSGGVVSGEHKFFYYVLAYSSVGGLYPDAYAVFIANYLSVKRGYLGRAALYPSIVQNVRKLSHGRQYIGYLAVLSFDIVVRRA